MSGKNVDGYGPLPQVDGPAQLEQRSLRAFNVLLKECELFLIRDARTDDYGVDLYLEARVPSGITNLRSHVQLKATASPCVNQDGTISLSVETHNLNYLLNGPSPMYVLYVAPEDSFWYCWAREERRRLDEANPSWKSQQTVTLRFSQRLTVDSLTDIHERVLQEGRLDRRIHDYLAREAIRKPIHLRIDPASIEITDNVAACDFLIQTGNAFAASGYGQVVLDAGTLLVPADKHNPRIQTVLAYANYTLGRAQAALACIHDALLGLDELSREDQRLITYLRDACEYQTGRISGEQYLKRLAAHADQASGCDALFHRLEETRYRLLQETDLRKRLALADEMQHLAEQILAHPESSEPMRLQARVQSLFGEAQSLTLMVFHLVSLTQMRQHMGLAIHARLVRQIRDACTKLAAWETKADMVVIAARDQQHPLLLADALTTFLGSRVALFLCQWMMSLFTNVSFVLSADMVGELEKQGRAAAEIYAVAGALEGELRAKLFLADLLELAERANESRGIAQEVLPKAHAMGYATLEKRAEEHLTGTTVRAGFADKLDALRQEDTDRPYAYRTDDQIRHFAQDALEARGLPAHRLRNLERECFSLRDIARERVEWCRHLELLQDVRHELSDTTCFARDPNRKVRCQKHAHETQIATPEWVPLIVTFKETHCSACADRDPKGR